MQTSQTGLLRRDARAFTLIETAVAVAVAAVVMAGMFKGYILASRRAQFASYSLAERDGLAAAGEHCRGELGCLDLVTNVLNPALRAQQVNALGLPSSGTNSWFIRPIL